MCVFAEVFYVCLRRGNQCVYWNGVINVCIGTRYSMCVLERGNQCVSSPRYSMCVFAEVINVCIGTG